MDGYENIQFDDTAQILQQAHLRRSADLGHWLKQWFREARRSQAATSHVLDRIVSVVVPNRRRAA